MDTCSGVRRAMMGDAGRFLEEGMVITVEPGCYFNAFLLEPAFKNPAQAKYLNAERLRSLLVSHYLSPLFSMMVKFNVLGPSHTRLVGRLIDNLQGASDAKSNPDRFSP